MGVATLVISLFSLLAAGAAVVISYRADVHSLMPVLISPASDAHAQTLRVRNLGNGPALNIAVVEIEPGLLATIDARGLKAKRLQARPGRPAVHMQPVQAGEQVDVEWRGEPPIAFSYTDAFGRPYTTVSAASGTKTFSRNLVAGLHLRELAFAPRMHQARGPGSSHT